MAHILESDYLDYTGADAVPDSFAVMAERASAIIDELTMGKIERAGGLSSLPAVVQARVRKATVEQVRAIEESGGVDTLASGDIASASVGKFSYTVSPQRGTTIGGVPVPQMVYIHLAPTGLLYRGMSPCCE